ELKELDSLRLIVDARLLSIGIRACLFIIRIGHNKYNHISLCFTVKQIRILHKWLMKVPIRMESRYMISISSSHQSSKKFTLWEILFLPGYGPSSAY
ncbi:hypothetical protein H5410_016131, partial [Solanum commersonii]